MFQIGDLVEYRNRSSELAGFIGFIEVISYDGRVGVRWLHNDRLAVFAHPVDYLQKCDSIDDKRC